MRPKTLEPSRTEWRLPGGLVIHEPSLWLPYIAVRSDGVRLGAFERWAQARDALAAGAGVGEGQEARA
jgi:hypothetical protein